MLFAYVIDDDGDIDVVVSAEKPTAETAKPVNAVSNPTPANPTASKRKIRRIDSNDDDFRPAKPKKNKIGKGRSC